MASSHRTLKFAVSGSLLALAPVAPLDACAPFISDPDTRTGDPTEPFEPIDRIKARDGGPVVNPGPTPDADEP